jgi:hypothetical protein
VAIAVKAQVSQKVSKTPSQQRLGMLVHACHPCYGGNINRRIVIQAHPGRNKPYLRNKLKKKKLELGGVLGLGPWLKW